MIPFDLRNASSPYAVPRPLLLCDFALWPIGHREEISTLFIGLDASKHIFLRKGFSSSSQKSGNIPALKAQMRHPCAPFGGGHHDDIIFETLRHRMEHQHSYAQSLGSRVRGAMAHTRAPIVLSKIILPCHTAMEYITTSDGQARNIAKSAAYGQSI